jgi:FAD/FMN-containing dehydrogenase
LSLGAEGSCQIGGNISTNAGGTAVLRYGPMRDLVLGLEVVLPDGRIFNGLRALRKDNTGYALKQLFIGAEGTLGIVTAAVLKLFAPPRSSALALLKLQSVEQALQIMQRLRGAVGDRLGSLEIMSRSQIEAIAATVPHVAIPFELATPWYLIVELSHDSVVPLERQAAFVSNVETRIMAGLPHARVVMHGHIGDGNIFT